MHNNRFEVFDVDRDVHVCLHVEVLEVIRVQGDDGLHGLFQDLLAVLYLLSEAREDHLAVCCAKVQLFCLWSKILDVFSHYACGDAPSLRRCGLVEERVHDLSRLVCKTICFCHACCR